MASGMSRSMHTFGAPASQSRPTVLLHHAVIAQAAVRDMLEPFSFHFPSYGHRFSPRVVASRNVCTCASAAAMGAMHLGRSASASPEPATDRSDQQHASTPASSSGANGSAPYGPEAWQAGCVHRLHSPDELKEFLRTFADKVVVMCCKAKGCRPCKAFERKYLRIAEQYQDVVFLEIYGDESIETRKLMISLQIKSTPTFMMFRDKAPLHTHSGIGEAKLKNALNRFTGRAEESVEEEEEA